MNIYPQQISTHGNISQGKYPSFSLWQIDSNRIYVWYIYLRPRWWFQRFFNFTRIPGGIIWMIQFDEHIFQMGCNHQLSLGSPKTAILVGIAFMLSNVPSIPKMMKDTFCGRLLWDTWQMLCWFQRVCSIEMHWHSEERTHLFFRTKWDHLGKIYEIGARICRKQWSWTDGCHRVMAGGVG